MTEPVLDRLVVVGTGLMGASLAGAVRAAGLAKEVIGLDAAQAEIAKRLGHIDHVITSLEELASRDDTLAVVIASPVHTYPEIFAAMARLSERQALFFVTDIGSTKTGVIRAAPKLGAALCRFVSSHPMAGSERQGAVAASASLFQGARVLISPLNDSSGVSGESGIVGSIASSEDAVIAVENFWIALGAQPSPLPIEDHDALLSMISHLPHMVAYALAGTIASSALAGAAQALHGGGLRDTTRIAASSPELWADIFLDNREQLLAVWRDLLLEQQTLAKALEDSDRSALIELLTKSSHWRRGFQ
jgi:prephenate dehydrogenase